MYVSAGVCMYVSAGVVDVDVERVIGTPGEYPFSRTEPMVIRAKEQLNKAYQIPKPAPVRLLFRTEFHGFRPGLPSQLLIGTGRVCRLLEATIVRRTATTHFAIKKRFKPGVEEYLK